MLVEGRLFTPGLREVIVGRLAQTEFSGLTVGNRVALRNSEWTIVGAYETGDAQESGMLTDASTLQSAYQSNVLNSVTVVLESSRRLRGNQGRADDESCFGRGCSA